MTRQDRIVVMVLVGVALAAASWFLLIKPERKKAVELQTQVEQAQATADEATAKAAAATAARAQYARDYAAVVRLGKAVPAEEDIASLVYQLDTSADETGVDFRAVSVTDATGTTASKPATSSASSGEKSGSGGSGSTSTSGALPGNVTTVPVTLTFDGGYFQMTRFLRKIERYTVTSADTINVRGRLVSVDGVTLTPGPAGFPQVKAAVNATVYTAPLSGVEADGSSGSNASSSASADGGTSSAASASAGSPATPPTAAAVPTR